MTTTDRFKQFLANITLTTSQLLDGQTKHAGVRLCLNKWYYDLRSSTENSMLVGSWGKSTEVRPPRDIDVLFVLPRHVYDRFEERPWGTNKQSALLQEVKGVLELEYPSTRMRGDGQVVIVNFASFAVEVVPAFHKLDILGEKTSKFLICDTNDGGKYRTADPKAEIEHVRASNSRTNGNTRHLIRMAKTWQRYCNVPLKSFALELLATDFLSEWQHAGRSETYYDWMVRDFFAYLVRHAERFMFNSVSVPGTGEVMELGDAWKSRAESALARATMACEWESGHYAVSAGQEWQKVFGDDIPLA